MAEAIAAIGTIIGTALGLNNKEQTDGRKLTNGHERLSGNGTDMYNSRDYYQVHSLEARKVMENWELAKDPLATGVIPQYYNTIEVGRSLQKVPNPDYNENNVRKLVHRFSDSMKELIRKKLADPALVKQHIHDGARATDNEVVTAADPYSVSCSAVDGIGGSLLPNRGHEPMQGHNNMVPFYRGSVKQLTNADGQNREFDSKLENFTGQFTMDQKSKHEVAPFFGPEKNQTFINGMPSTRDLSRYNPSNTGKKNNDLPFEQIRVGRGLNDGYTAKPSGGFHNTVRVLPPTREQLRVDPAETEMEGRINHGKAINAMPTLRQQMFKRKPELLADNRDGKYNLTTVGQVKGRQLRPTIIVRDTHRKKSVYRVNPGIANVKKQRVNPKCAVSKRQNFKNTPFRNLTQAAGGKRHNDYGKSGYANRPNERASTGIVSHILNAFSRVTGLTNYHQDKAKKTRKQQLSERHRKFGNAAPTQYGHVAYNPSEWAPKVTVKQTTIDNNHTGFFNSVQRGAQAYNPDEWAPKVTVKQTTIDNNRTGNASTVKKAGIAYDKAEWAPKVTVKQTTIDNNRTGNASTVKKAGIAYDKVDWAPKVTVKQTTIDNNRKGIVASTKKEGIAYDKAEWAPKVTVKQTTIDNNRKGIVSSTKKEGIAYNKAEWAPKVTVKQTTIDNNRKGIVSSVQKGGKAYRKSEWKPKNTTRQFTTKEYQGHANASVKKQMSYEDKYNMRVNTFKEKVARGRSPTKVSVQLFNSHINVLPKKLEDDRRNQRGMIKTNNNDQIFVPMVNRQTNTSLRNSLPQHDSRLDVSVLDAFKQNPLTQSLHSHY